MGFEAVGDRATGESATRRAPSDGADAEVTVGVFHPYAGTRDSGGQAVYTQRLVERLAERTPTVLYTGDGDIKPRLRESAVEVVRIPNREDAIPEAVLDRVPPVVKGVLNRSPIYAGALTGGARAHVNANADVLVTHNFLDDLVMSNLVDVPSLQICHGVQRVGLIGKLRKQFSRSALTLANSRNTVGELRETFDYEADGVVTPGVDTERFAPDREPAFESEDTAVLFVGRLVENKGIYDLLDALAASSGDQTLHVVGRGQRERVEERARELEVADSVVLHGEVDHSRLPGYYVACDVLCNPSRYESFGMVNLEAMACGTPVVSTDLDGTKEYFTHGETGLCVPPRAPEELARALDRLGASPELRAEFGRASRERAEEYSWDATAETLRDICYRLSATYDGADASRTTAFADGSSS